MMTIEHFLKENNLSRIQNGDNYLSYNSTKKEFVVYGRDKKSESFKDFGKAFERFIK